MKMLRVDKLAIERERLRGVAMQHACAGNVGYHAALEKVIASTFPRDITDSKGCG